MQKVKKQESLQISKDKNKKQESIKDSACNLNTNKHYILAARSDGFGERICTILNALAVSKLSGLEFRFTWQDKEKVENFNNQVLHAYANFPTKKQLFTQEFIDKYKIDDKYALTPYRFYAKSFSLESLLRGDFAENGLTYIASELLNIENMQESYRIALVEAFREIPFTNNILHLIDSTTQKAQEFIKSKGNFISLHIRAGDIVYDSQWTSYLYHEKVCNVYVALEIAKEEALKGNNVVLFSDDLSVAKALKEILTSLNLQGRIYIVDDFLNRDSYLGYQQSIFEIIFMSCSSKIYQAKSGFSRAAAMIGGVELIAVSEHYPLERQVQIITNHFQNFQNRFNSTQNAFALMQGFIYGCNLGLSSRILSDIAAAAYSLNKKNPYDILCVYGLLLNKNYAQANALLEQFCNTQFLQTLLSKHQAKFVFGFSFAHYCIEDILKYPYIAYFAFKIALFIRPLEIYKKLEIPEVRIILAYINDIDLISQFLNFIEQTGNFKEIKKPLKLILDNLIALKDSAV